MVAYARHYNHLFHFCTNTETGIQFTWWRLNSNCQLARTHSTGVEVFFKLEGWSNRCCCKRWYLAPKECRPAARPVGKVHVCVCVCVWVEVAAQYVVCEVATDSLSASIVISCDILHEAGWTLFQKITGVYPGINPRTTGMVVMC